MLVTSPFWLFHLHITTVLALTTDCDLVSFLLLASLVFDTSCTGFPLALYAGLIGQFSFSQNPQERRLLVACYTSLCVQRCPSYSVCSLILILLPYVLSDEACQFSSLYSFDVLYIIAGCD